MSTIVHGETKTRGLPPAHAEPIGNPYGYFTPSGTEFCITNPRTPRPWANIIANPRFGLAISQAGSGFTWIENSQLAVITRWEQDFARDTSGKFLYVRDAATGRLWSLAPAPTWPAYDNFVCRHGLGYTSFETEFAGIQATWTLLAATHDTAELWLVALTNLSDHPRRLELTAYLEWCCGVAPAPRREFHKLFLETRYEHERHAIFARNRMWDVPSSQWGHWNSPFPFTSVFACTEPIDAAQGDKTTFIGRNGRLETPAALVQPRWHPRFGQHGDAIAALRAVVELPPRATRTVGYVLAAGQSEAAARQLLDRYRAVHAIGHALEDVREAWRRRLAAARLQTPDRALDYLANDWLRYQAISGRLWGRCGYYQQSGAFGFRDQLQDSQVWLETEPEHCRAQINLHARHQFADGSVYHWWHPLSEQGHTTRMTDDLLWLAFVTAAYIRETGRFEVLADETPFVDDTQPAPLLTHILRAFERAFSRTSPRGLPLIGAGDWNDGLSAAGLRERGESIWLGHFLAGLLADWTRILRAFSNTGKPLPADIDQTPDALARQFEQRRSRLVDAINQHGWDGNWYIRATLDDGSTLGSAHNRAGRIFLNAQTWAILSDVADPERARQCWSAVREHLVTDAGALLLAPAFDEPRPEIGYITRYAPGLRENGGVYTHAATWAIAAACKLRDAETAGRLLHAINPANKDPERYWAEPYVTPGNVDGPDSPCFGRGGWTWYTGSAAWLRRVITHWVLGVRPDWDGLRIEPCLPPGWKEASLTRPYRGGVYDVHIVRDADLPAGAHTAVTLDGKPLGGNVVAPDAEPGRKHTLEVRVR